jgi:hypothetical protein
MRFDKYHYAKLVVNRLFCKDVASHVLLFVEDDKRKWQKHTYELVVNELAFMIAFSYGNWFGHSCIQVWGESNIGRFVRDCLDTDYKDDHQIDFYECRMFIRNYKYQYCKKCRSYRPVSDFGAYKTCDDCRWNEKVTRMKSNLLYHVVCARTHHGTHTFKVSNSTFGIMEIEQWINEISPRVRFIQTNPYSGPFYSIVVYNSGPTVPYAGM